MIKNKNAAGETIEIGMTVDRLDHFKMNGSVRAIRPHDNTLPILVRWPGLDYQWCSPELLMPRLEGGE